MASPTLWTATRPYGTSSSFVQSPGIALKDRTRDVVAMRHRWRGVTCAKPGGFRHMDSFPEGIFIPEKHKWIADAIDKMPIGKKTYYPKAADHENVKKKWFIVDAEKKILGRLASAVAYHIRGKHVNLYTPSLDMGAYVVVVNAEKVGVTGNKRTQKLYRRHSGRPGGMKIEKFDHLVKRLPERIIEHAVRGMLPKNRLGRRLFTHLKVYRGPNHPHEAQLPETLTITDKRIQLSTD